MVLLGRANWWLPGWLDRILPRVGLESEDELPPLPEPSAHPLGERRIVPDIREEFVAHLLSPAMSSGAGSGPYPRKHPTRGARPEAGAHHAHEQAKAFSGFAVDDLAARRSTARPSASSVKDGARGMLTLHLAGGDTLVYENRPSSPPTTRS